MIIALDAGSADASRRSLTVACSCFDPDEEDRRDSRRLLEGRVKSAPKLQLNLHHRTLRGKSPSYFAHVRRIIIRRCPQNTRRSFVDLIKYAWRCAEGFEYV